MFYQQHLLKDNVGPFIPPSNEELFELFKKVGNTIAMRPILKGIWKIKKAVYEFSLSNSNLCTIRLKAMFEDLNGYETQYELVCGTISTVPSNCSALFISNIYTIGPKYGFGTIFMKAILTFARLAGYSFVFLNVAGEAQRRVANGFFSKFGFKRMALPYKNPRTSNVNEWWYTTMNTTEIQDPPKVKKPRKVKEPSNV